MDKMDPPNSFLVIRIPHSIFSMLALGLYFWWLPVHANDLLSSENFSTVSQGAGGSMHAEAGNLTNLSLNPASITGAPFLAGSLYQSGNDYSSTITGLSLLGSYQQYYGAFALATSSPVEVSEVNDYGKSVSNFSNQEFLFSITGARSFRMTSDNGGIWGRIFSGLYHTGGTVRYLRSSIAEYHADVFALDAGGIWEKNIDAIKLLPYSGPYNIAFSLGLRNLGPDYSYAQTPEKQPFEIISGSRYGILSSRTHNLQVYHNISYHLYHSFGFSQGIAYTFHDMLTLRTGYVYRNDVLNPAGGFSARYDFNSLYNLQGDYSISIDPELGLNHTFSVLVQYRRGSVGKKLQTLAAETKKIDSEIDAENQKILQSCVKEYYLTEEKYPKELRDTVLCLSKLGFRSIPAALTGTWDYNNKTGNIHLAPPVTAQASDIVILNDGTQLRGEILGANEHTIIFASAAGTSEIKRSMVKLAKSSKISNQDKKLIGTLEETANGVKVATGFFPATLSELLEFYAVQYPGIDPKPEKGEIEYNAQNGKVDIINNFPEM